MIYLLTGKEHNCSLFIDKGKLLERVGRKAVSLNPLIYGQGSQVAVTTYKLYGFVNFAPPLSIYPLLYEEAAVFKIYISFFIVTTQFIPLNLAGAESVSTTISYRLRVTIPESAGSHVNNVKLGRITEVENGAVQQIQEQLRQRNNRTVIIRSIVVL